MNNEIKEILNNIKRQNKWKDIDYFKTPLSTEDADKLLDYIINIQKENEDYKSRVEKAIEYIKEHIRIDDEYPAYMEMLVEERDNLLNILQNEINKGE